MIRITNRPSTSCSDGRERGRRSMPSLPLTAFYPALRGRAFWGLLALGATVPAFASPAPIQTDFADDQVLVELPNVAPVANETVNNASELADTVQGYLSQARAQGDPRFLGYAQRLLQSWPQDRMTDRLLVLRATLWQSLHRFDDARTDLDRVLQVNQVTTNTIQARLTQANLELVQGRYDEARQACAELQRSYPGLIAQSCKAQVQARTGQARQAYDTLQGALRQALRPSTTERVWVEGTLGDIAAQLDLAAAETHWRNTLRLAPDDLYIRAQLADRLIAQDRFGEAITLTEGYDAVDSLAVLRAIALKRQGSGKSGALIGKLQERFEEARWRGNLLHKRDYARFLLDVEGRSDEALHFARLNWQTQREPMDTRLLLRAALAGDDRDTLSATRQWLSQMAQQDARYPGETTP